MNSLRMILVVASLIVLSSCSGEKGVEGNNSSAISASQVEIAKLQAALKNEPVYKINDSETTLLQHEGIISVADKAQLQSIQ